MAGFSTISIRFNADLKQFSSEIQNANRQLQKVGKQMQNAGKNLSIGLTAPVIALGYAFTKSFDTQAKAIAQVEAGLKSTGNAAGFTSQQLQDMASELQNNSLFGDEEILQGATAQLLTFTNIAGEQFARTQQASLDLATRLDGDLKSASIQLGKALNDPVANLSALSRSGIQFSKEQKDVINSLVETNRLADAQTIILNELEKQYGGAAAAAAEAGTGAFKQLSNIIGDIGEDFGAIIVDILKPFIATLKDLALRFKSLSPTVKKIIVVVAGLAAAIGPVLLALGTMATTIIPALISGFTLLTGPIGLVIAALAAVAYVIYENWEPIKKTLVDFVNYFIDLYNESMAFKAIVEGVIITFKTLWNVVRLVFDYIMTGIKSIGRTVRDVFSTVGDLFAAIVNGDISKIPEILSKGLEIPKKNFSKFVDDVGDDINKFTGRLADDVLDSVNRIKKKEKIEFLSSATVEDTDTSKVEPLQINAIANITATGRRKVQGLDTSGLDQFQNATLKDPTTKLAESVEKNGQIIQFVTGNLGEQMLRLREISLLVGDEVANAFENFTGRFVDSLGLASDGMQGFLKNLLGTVTRLISMMLAQSISQSIAGATASGTATGPAAVFTTPAFIATAVGGVLSAFAAIPKFADGGIVSGTTLGIMGEYAGARNNPEVIAPLDKLKGMLSDVGPGESGFVAETKLRGQDILVAVNRASAYKNRRG